MQTILLTGATGFLGSHLLESFLLQGHKIIILKRSTSNTWRIVHLLEKVKCYDVDQIALEKVFEETKPDIIVHTACCYGRRNESLIHLINTNLVLGLQLIDVGIKNNVQTFINTDSLLPRDINDYSLSKAQFSDWLKKYSNKMQIVNLKIEHMYGPNDDSKKFLPWLINEMIYGSGTIDLTSGVQKRDFIYIDDVVSVFNLVKNKKTSLKNWSQFDVGTNVFTPVKDLILFIARELKKANGKKIEARLNFGAIQYRKNENMTPKLDNSNLVELGWTPKVTIEEGLREILKYSL